MSKPTELMDLAAAVRKLVKAKGRFHTEQNYKALADALARYDARRDQPEGEAPKAGPVATFEGYVDGEPLVKWLDRRNMPQPGEKLYTGRVHEKLLGIIAAAYQIAAKHGAPARVLDILADPGAASADQITSMLPYQFEAHDFEAELEAAPRYCKPKHFDGIETERQKFEAWATGPSGPWRPRALERDEDGYISTEVREHWSMWANFAVRRAAEGSAAPAAAQTSAIDDAEVSALLNDLERVAARGAGEIPGLCTWAGAVIRGLHSEQDAEQLP